MARKLKLNSKSRNSNSIYLPPYLNSLRFRNLCENAVEAAVITDGEVAKVMVGIADDGHGGIWKAGCSGLDSLEQATRTGRRERKNKNFCFRTKQSFWEKKFYIKRFQK